MSKVQIVTKFYFMQKNTFYLAQDLLCKVLRGAKEGSKLKSSLSCLWKFFSLALSLVGKQKRLIIFFLFFLVVPYLLWFQTYAGFYQHHSQDMTLWIHNETSCFLFSYHFLAGLFVSCIPALIIWVRAFRLLKDKD